MLFSRNALPPGPQACLCPEKRITKEKGDKFRKFLDRHLRGDRLIFAGEPPHPPLSPVAGERARVRGLEVRKILGAR
jgi:hypothetical protein